MSCMTEKPHSVASFVTLCCSIKSLQYDVCNIGQQDPINSRISVKANPFKKQPTDQPTRDVVALNKRVSIYSGLGCHKRDFLFFNIFVYLQYKDIQQ